eukprot:TRINITY_DN594_c1_g1_i6.p6 TRINITY_DN594_c1_g1~~TRINITY_DN594_c1_g1_i6.p6  ORF type:complete len:107 (-),score=20.36 TRINITY_DN594_c1_g1_i6:168-488(-)
MLQLQYINPYATKSAFLFKHSSNLSNLVEQSSAEGVGAAIIGERMSVVIRLGGARIGDGIDGEGLGVGIGATKIAEAGIGVGEGQDSATKENYVQHIPARNNKLQR